MTDLAAELDLIKRWIKFVNLKDKSQTVNHFGFKTVKSLINDRRVKFPQYKYIYDAAENALRFKNPVRVSEQFAPAFEHLRQKAHAAVNKSITQNRPGLVEYTDLTTETINSNKGLDNSKSIRAFYPFPFFASITLSNGVISKSTKTQRIPDSTEYHDFVNHKTSYFPSFYDSVNAEYSIEISESKNPIDPYSIKLGAALTTKQLDLLRATIPYEPLANQNCLVAILNLLKRHLPESMQKYEVPLNFSEIEVFSKNRTSNWSLELYTELGQHLKSPWVSVGRQNQMSVPLVVTENHCQLIAPKIKLTQVNYFENSVLEEMRHHPSVVSVKSGIGLESIITIASDGYAINKSYRPPAPYDKSTDPRYLKCTSELQFFTAQFVDHFELTPLQPQISNLIGYAENFISRQKIANPTESIQTEIDMNQSYMSYESSPYYCGFPSATLLASESIEITAETAFVAIQTDDPIVQRFFGQRDFYLVPTPYYRFLQDIDSNTEVLWTVVSTGFKPIEYQKWLHESVADPVVRKTLSRQIIGSLICGGLSSKSHIAKEFTAAPHEIDQMVYEAQTHGLNYRIINPSRIWVEVPTNPKKQYRHIHSYILAYSAIAMHQKFLELDHSGAKVLGFNVDAFYVDGDIHTRYQSTQPGGFKSHTFTTKKWFTDMAISPIDYIETSFDFAALKQITLPSGIPIKSQFLAGAAGIGKTHPWLGRWILPPTCELRDDIIAKGSPSITVQRAFRPDLNDEKWRALPPNCFPQFKLALIDECTMLSRSQLKCIIRRARHFGIVLHFAGDFEQIQHMTNPAGFDFYRENHIDVVELKRTPSKKCRQDFAFGSQLDQLRHKPTAQQKTLAAALLQPLDFEPDHTSVFITGSHQRCSEINKSILLRDGIISPIVVLRKVTKKRVKPERITIDTTQLAPAKLNKLIGQIWWDKTSAEQQRPAGKKWVPALAITPDSIQGKTIHQNMIIDIDNLSRYGTLYTSLTRAATKNQLYHI